MSRLSQIIRIQEPGRDPNNPSGLIPDLISLSPADNYLTGVTSPPSDNIGINGNVFYAEDGTVYAKKNGLWETIFVQPGGTANPGGGALQSVANVGTGVGEVFKQLDGTTISLRNIKAGTNITLTNGIDDITIDVPGDAVDSVNTQTGDVVLDTDDISEGVNKYYASALFDADLTSKTTDDVTEGVTNKYYATSLFNTDLAAKTTDDVTEGVTNKYAVINDLTTSGSTLWSSQKVDTSINNSTLGLQVKECCELATVSNHTLVGIFFVDGFTVTAGMRVLVKNQINTIENGIYNASNTAWTRSTDSDGNPLGEMRLGSFVHICSGETNKGLGFSIIGTPSISPNINVGVDPILWTKFNTNTQYNFISGLTDSGLDVSVLNYGDIVFAATLQNISNKTYSSVDSLAAAPAFTFDNNPSDGIFRAGGVNPGLAISSAGTLHTRFGELGISCEKRILLANGSESAPQLSFTNSNFTGLYCSTLNVLSITTNAINRISISDTNLTSTVSMLGPNGGAAGPTYSFQNDTNSGMYLDFAGDNLILSKDGQNAISISTSSALIDFNNRTLSGLNQYVIVNSPSAPGIIINWTAATGTMTFSICEIKIQSDTGGSRVVMIRCQWSSTEDINGFSWLFPDTFNKYGDQSIGGIAVRNLTDNSETSNQFFIHTSGSSPRYMGFVNANGSGFKFNKNKTWLIQTTIVIAPKI